MAVPTEQEIARADARARIADEQNEEIEQAIRACGPGAAAYGCWVMRDKAGQHGELRVFCCSRGQGWSPRPQEARPDIDFDERLTVQHHPGYEIKGNRRVFPFRWSQHFQSLDRYSPLDAQGLADLRARRAEKDLQKVLLDQSESLFPELYDDQVVELAKKTK